MKKIIFAVLFAFISLTATLAHAEELRFTSPVSGITCLVPDNVKILQDDIEAVILQTPDNLYTLTAEPFNVEEATQDEITEHLLQMAEASGMNLENAEKTEYEKELVTFTGLADDFDNGGAAVVGVIVVNDTALGYYITAVAGPTYIDYMASSIGTIDFDADAVE